jgi:hypothetical protein
MKRKHDEITSIEFTFGGYFEGRTRLSIIGGAADGTATWSMSSRDSELLGLIKTFETITKEKWEKFRVELCDKSKILSWKSSYTDSNILDGFQWDLEVFFSDGKTKEIGGSNDYPKEWNEFRRLLRKLTGSKDI